MENPHRLFPLRDAALELAAPWSRRPRVCGLNGHQFGRITIDGSLVYHFGLGELARLILLARDWNGGSLDFTVNDILLTFPDPADAQRFRDALAEVQSQQPGHWIESDAASFVHRCRAMLEAGGLRIAPARAMEQGKAAFRARQAALQERASDSAG